MKSGIQENKDHDDRIGHYLKFRNGKKSPTRNETGEYAVYGSNGQIGKSDECNTNGPSIIIGRVGSYCGSTYYSFDPAWVTDNAIVCEAENSDETRYWYYALQSLDLNGRSSGSGQPLLNQSVLRSIKYEAPSRHQRISIAEVLGALDDKIAANTKLASLAFDYAAALHETTLNQETRLEALSAIATTVLGGTPSRAKDEYWANGTIPWINSGKSNENRIIEPSEMITEEALSNSSAKLMPAGTTVLAITGATLGQVARLEIEAAGNQSLIGAWSSEYNYNSWLHFAIQREIPQLLTRATGAAQQHVNKRDVDSLLIPTPPARTGQ